MAFITVTGEVTRTFWNGQGAGIKESWTTNDGDERAAYYSAFFDEPHGLEEGDAGKFSGRLGVKPNTYEKNGETVYGYNFIVEDFAFGAPGKEKRDQFSRAGE